MSFYIYLKRLIIIFLFIWLTVTAAYSFDINAPLGDRFVSYDEGLGPYGPSVLNSPFTSRKNSVSMNLSFVSVLLNKLYLQNMKQYSAGISYGATDNLELSAGVGLAAAKFDKSYTGISDIFIIGKYNSNSGFTNLGYVVGLNIPTGDKDIYGENNGLDISLDIPYQIDLTFAAFNASAGITISDISKNSETSLNAGLGLSRSFTEKTALSLETTYIFNDSNLDFNIYIGFKYRLNDKMQFQTILGKQINKNIVDSIFATGISLSL